MKTVNDVLLFLSDIDRMSQLREARIEQVTSGLEGADKQVAANYAAVGWNYALVAVANFIAETDGDEG